ncbi:hypothetical protein QE152_g30138 [Popillia japonica]|uniref:Uncharacterized protein n=1 Tax=Popillia japonica TaxID=7064 RepID=A0AAW1JFI3_POPJA
MRKISIWKMWENFHHEKAAKLGISYKIFNSIRMEHVETVAAQGTGSALALCVSTAEYAVPVWAASAHAKHVDVAINETARIVTGCQLQLIVCTHLLAWHPHRCEEPPPRMLKGPNRKPMLAILYTNTSRPVDACDQGRASWQDHTHSRDP